MALLSALVIVNRACARLAVPPLQSLTEETPSGQTAQLIYDSLLDLCLDLTPWAFLRETVALSLLAEQPLINGYGYAHQLPVEGAFNRLLWAKDERAIVTAFELETGGVVYSNYKTLYAQMLGGRDPNRWSGAFRHAFTTGLAADLCNPMTDDPKLAGALHAEAFGTPQEGNRGGLFGVAITHNARITPVRRLPEGGPLVDAWSGGGDSSSFRDRWSGR